MAKAEADTSTPASGISDLSFEDALTELEAIVRELESGRGKLDDAIGTYERGIALKKHCESKLSEARAKVDKIAFDETGATDLEPSGLE